MTTARRRPPKGMRGQATVELALAMPLVVIWLLVVVQLVVVARDQIAVVHAAREAARAAAVSSSPSSAATRAALDAIELRPLSVSTSAGSEVRVTASHVNRTDVPIIGAFVPDIELRASAVMQWEP